jgi:DNA-binding MurR/RpiR family transcriptional regulator
VILRRRESMTYETPSAIDPNLTNIIGRKYLQYLEMILTTSDTQKNALDELISRLAHAKNIHIFGFGRSGAAALACGIRLRHFSAFLPPVWWIGDQVREPIREHDLVLLFSQSGTREEVELVARKASQAGAEIVLITSEEESATAKLASLKIILPRLEEDFVYGGGDFELAAFYFQEILVATIGIRLNIPKSEIARNHI